MTQLTDDLAAHTRALFPRECLLLGDAPLAALADKIQAVEAPRDALLTVEGGDDLDLQAVFEFLANAMIIMMGMMKMGETMLQLRTAAEVRAAVSAAPGLRTAAEELSDRELMRIRDRLVSR